MIACADSNWLVASYVAAPEDRFARLVRRFAARHDIAWHVAPIVEIECENTFARVTREIDSPPWKRFQDDLGGRLILIEEAWSADIRTVRSMARRYGAKAAVGTFDLFILASSLRAGATHFLSFDTNSNLRALAAVLRLKVYPELTPEDRRRMQLFR